MFYTALNLWLLRSALWINELIMFLQYGCSHSLHWSHQYLLLWIMYIGFEILTDCTGGNHLLTSYYLASRGCNGDSCSLHLWKELAFLKVLDDDFTCIFILHLHGFLVSPSMRVFSLNQSCSYALRLVLKLLYLFWEFNLIPRAVLQIGWGGGIIF